MSDSLRATMSSDIREQIRTSLAVFGRADLRAASIGLLNSLGYQSEKTLDLDNTPVGNHALTYVF